MGRPKVSKRKNKAKRINADRYVDAQISDIDRLAIDKGISTIYTGANGRIIGIKGEQPKSFIPILRNCGASSQEIKMQEVREVFTKIAYEKYQNNPVAFYACILGRYAADYLVEGTKEDNESKWLYLLMYIVELLHQHPMEGIIVTPEAKRDYMMLGESWYEGYMKEHKTDATIETK